MRELTLALTLRPRRANLSYDIYFFNFIMQIIRLYSRDRESYLVYKLNRSKNHQSQIMKFSFGINKAAAKKAPPPKPALNIFAQSMAEEA